MEQWFLLDGIDVKAAGAAIHQSVVDPSPILANAAISPFKIVHSARPRTELALHALLGLFLVP
jgi:hypothetical protein